MSRVFLLVSICTVSLLSLLSPVNAASIVASNDWNTAGLSGWTNSQTWISQVNPMSGGNAGGYQQIEFDATAWFSGEDYALATNGASGLYAGAWETDMWLELDFWASNTAPVSVEVRWQSSTSSTRTWASQVFHETNSTMNVEEWTHMTSASLTDHNQWDAYDAGDNWTETDFVDDLSSIDWIGVYIWRSGIDQQFYGIDNFALMDNLALVIPEPGEILLLFVALASAAVLLERRRAKSCAVVVGPD